MPLYNYAILSFNSYMGGGSPPSQLNVSAMSKLVDHELTVHQLPGVVITDGTENWTIKQFVTGMLPGENYLSANRWSDGKDVLIPVGTACELEVI